MRKLTYFLAAGLPALLAELYKIKEAGQAPELVDWLILAVVMGASGFAALRALMDPKELSKNKESK